MCIGHNLEIRTEQAKKEFDKRIYNLISIVFGVLVTTILCLIIISNPVLGAWQDMKFGYMPFTYNSTDMTNVSTWQEQGTCAHNPTSGVNIGAGGCWIKRSVDYNIVSAQSNYTILFTFNHTTNGQFDQNPILVEVNGITVVWDNYNSPYKGVYWSPFNGAQQYNGSYVIAANTTYKVAVTKDSGNNLVLYIDGTVAKRFSITPTPSAGKVCINGNADGCVSNMAFSTWLKEMCFVNKTMSQTEVLEYNSTGCANQAPPDVPATPSITAYWSFVNGTYLNYSNPSYSFYVNATPANTYDTGNITILLNGVANVTAINVNVSKNTLITLNFSALTSQINVTYNVTVTNASDKKNGVFLYVDTEPLIMTGYFTKNGVYNGVNNTNFTFGDTLTFFYSQYDLNNYESNITFYDAAGNPEFSYGITNLTGTINYTYSKSLTLTLLGNHTGKIWGKDAHTIKIMPDINWSMITYMKNNITLKGIDFDSGLLKLATAQYASINDFALVKRGDRYIFAFNFKDSQVNSVFTMYMDSDKPFKHLANSPYAGHFILNDKYAIDWVSDDISNLQVDYLPALGVWRVRFTPTKNIVIFRSITMINYVEKTYTYSVSAASTGGGLTDAQYAGLVDAINGGAKKMGYIAIAIIIGSIMFFLFYVSTKISTQTEQGAPIPINSIFKNILIIVALFMVVMGAQLALGISTENAYSQQVESALDVIYQVIFWVAVIILILVVIGTLANFFFSVYNYIKSWSGARHNRR